jgi:uncharacterized spore protein YtfJ
LIPVISVSFLAGGTEGSDRNGGFNIGGCAGGVGCRVSPQAVLIIKDEEVRVLSLTERSLPESIVESLPEIFSRMDCREAVRNNP